MNHYSFDMEAIGLTNELFYRHGPRPEAIQLKDATLVRETIERALREAFRAGQEAKVA